MFIPGEVLEEVSDWIPSPRLHTQKPLGRDSNLDPIYGQQSTSPEPGSQTHRLPSKSLELLFNPPAATHLPTQEFPE